MLRLIEWPWGLNTSSLRQIKQYIVDQTYTHCAPLIIKINEYMNMIEYMYIYINKHIYIYKKTYIYIYIWANYNNSLT